jgi:hypothetical protein
MCDFRVIKSIRFKDTGQLLIVDEVKSCTVMAGFPNTVHKSQVSEPGFYFVGASGAYHAYFDGQRWRHEWDSDGYEVVEYEDSFHEENQNS